MILLLIFFFITLVNEVNSDVNNVEVNLLALNWAPGFTNGYQNVDDESILSFWIHGLWPGSWNESFVNCEGQKLNYDNLELLKPKLLKEFVSPYSYSTESLWEHEWDKHGVW